MERLNFFIPDQQRAWLEEEARKTGIPISELIRRAISEYQDRREPRPLKPVKEKRK